MWSGNSTRAWSSSIRDFVSAQIAGGGIGGAGGAGGVAGGGAGGTGDASGGLHNSCWCNCFPLRLFEKDM